MWVMKVSYPNRLRPSIGFAACARVNYFNPIALSRKRAAASQSTSCILAQFAGKFRKVRKVREKQDENRKNRTAWRRACHRDVTGKLPAGRAAQGLCRDVQGQISRKASEVPGPGEA